MLVKSITYTDYKGNKHTEDFYFNLSESEVVEMEYGIKDHLSTYLQRIAKTNDEVELLKFFKSFVLKCYGEISPDGKRFMKKEGELAKEFAETEAYTSLFMELAKDSKAAADFVNGVLPSSISKNMSGSAIPSVN